MTLGERLYFGAVGVLAGLVGIPGFFTPERVDAVLPFTVPPLHARMIGALYFSALVIFVGGLLARRWAEVRVIPAVTAIWTGGLLLITLLHLESFDFSKIQTQIWFGAYVAYPLIGIWILLRRRGDDTGREAGDAAPGWGRRFLNVQGAVLIVVGLALLFAPGPMAAGWPWPVEPLVAQIYSAPLLSYGIGSLLLARMRTWREMRIGVIGIGLFTLMALVASVIHRNLFQLGNLVAWVWFGGLAALATVAVLLTISARRTR